MNTTTTAPTEPITDLIQLPGRERIERVIDHAFGGSHHVRGLKFTEEPNGYVHARCHVFDGLATYDDDRLTRLVVASLGYGVRVELVQSGPGRVAFLFHPRSVREGGNFWERIPRLYKAEDRFQFNERVRIAEHERHMAVVREYAEQKGLV